MIKKLINRIRYGRQKYAPAGLGKVAVAGYSSSNDDCVSIVYFGLKEGVASEYVGKEIDMKNVNRDNVLAHIAFYNIEGIDQAIVIMNELKQHLLDKDKIK